MPEQQTIEYKQSWHDDYLKQICGFANAQGGTMFVGRNDAGRPVGVGDAGRLLTDLPNKIRNALGITVDVNLRHEEGRDGRCDVLEIITPAYAVPISLRGRYYFRSGSTNQELTGSALNEFLLKKAGRTWDDVIEPDATFADIDLDAVQEYLRMSETAGRLPEKGDSLGVEVLFEKLRIAKNGKLKRAAIVFFGKDPGKFYPGLAVKIGRFGQSDSDLLFQETEEGNIVVLVDEVLRQLHRKFLVRAISFEGVHRIETPPYPMPALREMLLNALIHRSYMGAPTQIRVYDNAISFWNVGGLPEGISLDALKRRHSSNPRNLVLADVAFKGGYIDAWGRGTIKIIEACLKAGLPEPEMKESDGGFLVTLRRPDNPAAQQVTQQASGQATQQVNILKNNRLDAKPDGSGDIDPISNPISSVPLTLQVEGLLKALQSGEQGGRSIMETLTLKDYVNFKYSYLEPALESGLVEMTQPDSPRSPTQKYRLTAKGLAVLTGKPLG